MHPTVLSIQIVYNQKHIQFLLVSEYDTILLSLDDLSEVSQHPFMPEVIFMALHFSSDLR